MGEQQGAITITTEGGEYAGVLKGGLGDTELGEVKVDGNKFEFMTEIQAPMGGMNLLFKGDIQGDKMAGTASGMMGEIYFTGDRNTGVPTTEPLPD